MANSYLIGTDILIGSESSDEPESESADSSDETYAGEASSESSEEEIPIPDDLPDEATESDSDPPYQDQGQQDPDVMMDQAVAAAAQDGGGDAGGDGGDSGGGDSGGGDSGGGGGAWGSGGGSATAPPSTTAPPAATPPPVPLAQNPKAITEAQRLLQVAYAQLAVAQSSNIPGLAAEAQANINTFTSMLKQAGVTPNPPPPAPTPPPPPPAPKTTKDIPPSLLAKLKAAQASQSPQAIADVQSKIQQWASGNTGGGTGGDGGASWDANPNPNQNQDEQIQSARKSSKAPSAPPAPIPPKTSTASQRAHLAAPTVRPATPRATTPGAGNKTRVHGSVSLATLPSPLDNVSDAAWTKFADAMRTAEFGEVSKSNELGAWQLKPRRLGDLGIVTDLACQRDDKTKRMIWTGRFVPPMTAKKFLRDPKAQYLAFAKSMVDYRQRLIDGSIEQPDGGVPDDMTLSGVLAILHRAGPNGLQKWNEASMFASTQSLFDAVNGLF